MSEWIKPGLSVLCREKDVPDNLACEGFFGRLKNEMFYNISWQGISIPEFIDNLDKYIKWYAEKRIKVSLGGMSPIDYRRSLGLVV